MQLRRRTPAGRAHYLAKVLEELVETMPKGPERGTAAGVALALEDLAEELEGLLGK